MVNENQKDVAADAGSAHICHNSQAAHAPTGGMWSMFARGETRTPSRCGSLGFCAGKNQLSAPVVFCTARTGALSERLNEFKKGSTAHD